MSIFSVPIILERTDDFNEIFKSVGLSTHIGKSDTCKYLYILKI